ncbi:MAG: succinate dehydrogenase, cytochrome b556 subunit [Coxiella sp. (in: Bacteria)]|nr:MAG: succinate dehydrogenase, cytochrome b556 subunit [Coxiella sp. (in: g-proteobacteria)]
MTTQRPVFLDMTKMRFPVTAIASILHRITGILLFLFVPLAIYLLGASLHSPQSFADMIQWIHRPGIAFLIWLMLSATSYHLLAGIRHLLMDCGIAEQFKQAQITVYIVLLLTVACMVLLGVWLW